MMIVWKMLCKSQSWNSSNLWLVNGIYFSTNKNWNVCLRNDAETNMLEDFHCEETEVEKLNYILKESKKDICYFYQYFNWSAAWFLWICFLSSSITEQIELQMCTAAFIFKFLTDIEKGCVKRNAMNKEYEKSPPMKPLNLMVLSYTEFKFFLNIQQHRYCNYLKVESVT